MRIRWLIAVLILGVVPLALTAAIGVPHYDGNTPEHRSPGNFTWEHGWPIGLFSRSSVSIPLVRSSGVWVPQRVYWRDRPPPSSRWPIDDAAIFWRSFWYRLAISVVAWTLLLIGTSAAASRSRFVATGRLQVTLKTILVACAFVGGYLATYPQPLAFGWERAVTLPLLISASIGYAAISFEWCCRVCSGRPKRRETSFPGGTTPICLSSKHETYGP